VIAHVGIPAFSSLVSIFAGHEQLLPALSECPMHIHETPSVSVATWPAVLLNLA